MHIALIVTGIFLFFFALPCFVVTLLLFKRKTTYDFSERRQADMSSYEPYLDRILSDMEYMRSLEPKELSLTADDGVVLKADWYDNGSKKTVIMLHGFCSTPLNNFSTSGRALWDRGFNLLMVWQRGHGKSGGRFTTMGVKESSDLLRWIDMFEQLVEGGLSALYGVSMGGATVSYASDRISSKSVRAMCIDCCFLSPYDQMCKGKGILSVIWAPMMPLVVLFAKLLLGVNIRRRTVESLKNTQIPAVFMIGSDDSMVPPRFFRKNYDACASEKELVEVKGAPHALAFVAADDETRGRLFDFVDRSFEREA